MIKSDGVSEVNHVTHEDKSYAMLLLEKKEEL